MSGDANRATVRRFSEACMNAGDLAAVEEVIASDFIDVSYGLRGMAAVKQFVQDSRSRFPQLTFTIEEIIAEGETVAVRWSGRGTHENGRSATWTGMGFYHLHEGQIVRHWANVDQVALLRQSGLPPFAEWGWRCRCPSLQFRIVL